MLKKTTDSSIKKHFPNIDVPSFAVRGDYGIRKETSENSLKVLVYAKLAINVLFYENPLFNPSTPDIQHKVEQILIEQIYANKETLTEFRFLSFDGRFINQEFIKKLNDCLGYNHFQERNHNLDYLLRFKVLRNLDDIFNATDNTELYNILERIEEISFNYIKHNQNSKPQIRLTNIKDNLNTIWVALSAAFCSVKPPIEFLYSDSYKYIKPSEIEIDNDLSTQETILNKAYKRYVYIPR